MILQSKSPTRIRALALVACLLAGGVGMIAGVRAFGSSSSARGLPTGSPSAASAAANPQAGSRRVRYYDRLALQPAADRMRSKLGRRFRETGREITESAGVIAIGSERHTVVMVRTRDDDGERISIGLDGGPFKYSWNGNDGAQSEGRDAIGTERALIERLALDSPEQFVLAQLRGAAYYTAARAVRPAAVGDSDDYLGPIWDVIQVSEPSGRPHQPESVSRLYYINNATGLIDKTLSRDRTGPIYAAFADWVNLGGELIPLRTTWTLDNQVVMELALSTAITRARN